MPYRTAWIPFGLGPRANERATRQHARQSHFENIRDFAPTALTAVGSTFGLPGAIAGSVIGEIAKGYDTDKSIGQNIVGRNKRGTFDDVRSSPIRTAAKIGLGKVPGGQIASSFLDAADRTRSNFQRDENIAKAKSNFANARTADPWAQQKSQYEASIPGLVSTAQAEYNRQERSFAKATQDHQVSTAQRYSDRVANEKATQAAREASQTKTAERTAEYQAKRDQFSDPNYATSDDIGIVGGRKTPGFQQAVTEASNPNQALSNYARTTAPNFASPDSPGPKAPAQVGIDDYAYDQEEALSKWDPATHAGIISSIAPVGTAAAALTHGARAIGSAAAVRGFGKIATAADKAQKTGAGINIGVKGSQARATFTAAEASKLGQLAASQGKIARTATATAATASVGSGVGTAALTGTTTAKTVGRVRSLAKTASVAAPAATAGLSAQETFAAPSSNSRRSTVASTPAQSVSRASAVSSPTSAPSAPSAPAASASAGAPVGSPSRSTRSAPAPSAPSAPTQSEGTQSAPASAAAPGLPRGPSGTNQESNEGVQAESQAQATARLTYLTERAEAPRIKRKEARLYDPVFSQDRRTASLRRSEIRYGNV